MGKDSGIQDAHAAPEAVHEAMVYRLRYAGDPHTPEVDWDEYIIHVGDAGPEFSVRDMGELSTERTDHPLFFVQCLVPRALWKVAQRMEGCWVTHEARIKMTQKQIEQLRGLLGEDSPSSIEENLTATA